MIQKILMQIGNFLMAIIVLHVNSTFFHSREMYNGYLIFSNFVFIGCALSFVYLIVSTAFKVKALDDIFPYDSVLLFIALIGTLVMAATFLL